MAGRIIQCVDYGERMPTFTFNWLVWIILRNLDVTITGRIPSIYSKIFGSSIFNLCLFKKKPTSNLIQFYFI